MTPTIALPRRAAGPRRAPAVPPMPVLSLPFTDLVTLLQACRAVRPRDCTPNHLGDLIVRRLEPTLRQLADRVRAFHSDQMVALCEYVLTGLELAEGPVSEHS